MKRTVLVLSIAGFLFQLNACKFGSKKQTESNVEIQEMADNSRNSVNWQGTYAGVLPCADCSSIETQIQIPDHSVRMIRVVSLRSKIRTRINFPLSIA